MSTELEVTAGGVVVDGDRVAVIVPTRRAADGGTVLGLPKGHLDGEETLQEAATREVREETGLEVELIERLGEVRYLYTKKGRTVPKMVTFFLFEYRGGDLGQHDHEVQDARWIPLREAVESLTYDGEREMVARAMSRAASDR